jgi:hypothetical protein
MEELNNSGGCDEACGELNDSGQASMGELTESSREAEKMADRTPHASKIAVYIFSGPSHVMGDELIECYLFFY